MTPEQAAVGWALPSFDRGWWPVALSKELKPKYPLGVSCLGQALALFRPGQVAALPDACPHRLAPLSAGVLVQGSLQCPYHGWAFNHAGQCTRVPGSAEICSEKPLLASWHCQEREGVIWVSRQGGMAIPGLEMEPGDSFWLRAVVKTDMLSAAENFLEAYHTHFVHKGWLRHDRQRQSIQAKLRCLADGIQVEYQGEALQNGSVSRWLEPSRGRSWGRFRWPNLAQIEYRDKREQLNLLASAWLSPMHDKQLAVFIRITTASGFVPAGIKRWLLTRLFTPILRQDQQILELVTHNQNQLSRLGPLPAPLDAPHDLMGPALRQLLSTQSLQGIEARDQLLWL